LVFVRKVFNRAGVPFLLIRSHKNRPILAIDLELRAAVQEALVSVCATEPMYSKTTERSGSADGAAPG